MLNLIASRGAEDGGIGELHAGVWLGGRFWAKGATATTMRGEKKEGVHVGMVVGGGAEKVFFVFFAFRCMNLEWWWAQLKNFFSFFSPLWLVGVCVDGVELHGVVLQSY